MEDKSTKAYSLVQDEPWMFLDVRKNPVHGRKLTFRLADATIVDLDVTMQEYNDPATVKGKLDAAMAAHHALTGL